MLQPLTWNATTGVAGTPDVPIPVAANTVNTITGSGTCGRFHSITFM